MKINDKAKNAIQDLLFEIRLGLDDIEDQQKIRYSMFDTPSVSEKEIEVIKASEVSPVQLHTVVMNDDKIPNNVVELKNTLNHMFSKLGVNDLTEKQIEKIYTSVLDVANKDK